MERASNGWTGGQYSALRVLLALSSILYAIDAWLFSSEGTGAQRWGAVALVVLMATPLALGRLDRLSAFALAGALLLHRFVEQSTETLAAWPAFESILLLHIFVPRDPYGAWTARDRPDPGAGWRYPDRLHDIAWFVLGVSHALAGASALMSETWTQSASWGDWLGCGIDLAFLPLALISSARPLALALGLVGLGMSPFDGALILALAAHLACFTPAWFAPREGRPLTFFYDGECGLCHRAVRFFLAEDISGEALRFAPLQGPVFESCVPEKDRATIPDSLAILTRDDRLLFRTDGVICALDQIGGGWRIAGWSLRCVPRVLRDAVYDLVAMTRHRFFRKPDEACPIVPPSLRQRFLMEPPAGC